MNVIGVDEHVWRHTRRGDKYVTVIIDLTGIRDGTGPARMLDMCEGRSKEAFKTWLAERPGAWRKGIEVVAQVSVTGQTYETMIRNSISSESRRADELWVAQDTAVDAKYVRPEHGSPYVDPPEMWLR